MIWNRVWDNFARIVTHGLKILLCIGKLWVVWSAIVDGLPYRGKKMARLHVPVPPMDRQLSVCMLNSWLLTFTVMSY